MASTGTRALRPGAGGLTSTPTSTSELSRPGRGVGTRPPPRVASACSSAAALAGRRAGSLSRRRITSASSAADTGAWRLGGSGTVNRWSAMISPAPSAVSGGRPVSSSYRMQPTE